MKLHNSHRIIFFYLFKVKPGWHDNVQKLKDEALSYLCLWRSNGCPKEEYFAEKKSITRARFIELFNILGKMLTIYEWERWLMLFCLINQEMCGLWSECDKMKGKDCKMASMIDGNSDSCSIPGMFSDK